MPLINNWKKPKPVEALKYKKIKLKEWFERYKMLQLYVFLSSYILIGGIVWLANPVKYLTSLILVCSLSALVAMVSYIVGQTRGEESIKKIRNQILEEQRLKIQKNVDKSDDNKRVSMKLPKRENIDTEKNTNRV
tara:strand:+ start:505 stop:909 length:405 start_codon:yes stop_codon:yes gene_type:complete